MDDPNILEILKHRSLSNFKPFKLGPRIRENENRIKRGRGSGF